MRPACPCANCNKREMKCHSRCEEYKSWEAKLKIYKELLKTSKLQDDIYVNYITERLRKR